MKFLIDAIFGALESVLFQLLNDHYNSNHITGSDKEDQPKFIHILACLIIFGISIGAIAGLLWLIMR
jgi:hypothetical protein